MTIKVSEQRDGQHIRAQIGDELEFHLVENATTGYRWETEDLDSHLFKVEKTTGHYRSDKIGSGGDAEFLIKILETGSSTIRFKYWRPWEGDRGVIKRFTLKVEVS